jgi:transcriptional regulator with XRE-family HTH domain
MAANDRLRGRGTRRGNDILVRFGNELREARISAGISQEELGRRLGMSGDKVWKIEHAKLNTLSILDAAEMAAVLGLDLSAKLFPSGVKVRDEGQARRIVRLLESVSSPLRYRTDVGLPQAAGGPTDLRGWDVVLYGHGVRTCIEYEVRLHDVQATIRRHNLKRRDDPSDQFLMVVADSRHNREVVRTYADLFADLPRLRTANVLKTLRAGQHPPTGLILL